MLEDRVCNLCQRFFDNLDGQLEGFFIVWIWVDPHVFKRSLKRRQAFALYEGSDRSSLIGAGVDGILSPNFRQIFHQLDPLIWGFFFKDSNVFFWGSRPSQLSCTDLELEGEKFVLLLLRGQAPRLAGAGTVSKLVSHASLEISFFLVGLDLDFLDELSKLPNGFSFSSNECCKFTMHYATGVAVCKM